MNETGNLPRAIDIERAVLGAMLIDSEGCATAVEMVMAEDFFEPVHQVLFRSLSDMHENDTPVDQLTVAEELQKKGYLEAIGGEAAISGLMTETASAANIEHHCGILKEKAQLRRIILVSSGAMTMCFDPNADSKAVIEVIESGINSLFKESGSVNYSTMMDVILEAHENIMEQVGNKGKITGVTTGFTGLDRILNGWQSGDLIILAARPSQGKTALGINFLTNAAHAGISSVIFSLEMSKLQLGKRMIASEAKIELSGMQYNNWDQSHYTRISDTCGRLSNYPIYIDDTGLNLPRLTAKLKRIKKKKGIKLVVVDFLQLMQGIGLASRRLEIENIARGLKQCAKYLEVPIIALSQLNRDIEKHNRRPNLSDLKECFSTETSLIWGEKSVKNYYSSRDNILSFDKDKIIPSNSKDFVTRIKHVKKYVMASGRFIDCTPNHPILTDLGWIRADNLTKDNAIACCRNIPEPEGTKYIPESKFIGWMIGNGAMHNPGVPIVIFSDEKVANEYIVTFYKLFGFSAKHYKHKCKKVFQYAMTKNNVRTPSGNPVKKWLIEKELWGQINYTKHIPDWFIEQANNQSIAELIAGLWETDGSVPIMKNGRTICKYSTTSHLLAQQIIYLLARLNIYARISEPYLGKKATKNLWEVVIADSPEVKIFRNNVTCINGAKGDNLYSAKLKNGRNNLANRMSVTIGKILRNISIKNNISHADLGYYCQNKRISAKDLSKCINRLSELGANADSLKWLLSPDIYWDKLKRVEDLGNKEVFDKEVPGTNNLVVNGIIAHNSGSLEEAADVVIFIHNPPDDEKLDRIRYLSGDQEVEKVREIIIEKHRNGPTGNIFVYWDAKTTTFANLEY